MGFSVMTFGWVLNGGTGYQTYNGKVELTISFNILRIINLSYFLKVYY